MKARLTYSADETDYRFYVLISPLTTEELNNFSSYVRATVGIYCDDLLLYTHESELIPDFPTGHAYDTEISLCGFDTINRNSIRNIDSVRARVTLHYYECDFINLEPIAFDEREEFTYFQPSKAVLNNFYVDAQSAKLSTEGKKIKLVEFAETACYFRNDRNVPVSVTYFIGITAGDTNPRGGRIGFVNLYPGDVGSIAMALHHDQICSIFDINKCSPKQLAKLTYFPSLCIYSYAKSLSFEIGKAEEE
jgi:hypothetical protein